MQKERSFEELVADITSLMDQYVTFRALIMIKRHECFLASLTNLTTNDPPHLRVEVFSPGLESILNEKAGCLVGSLYTICDEVRVDGLLQKGTLDEFVGSLSNIKSMTLYQDNKVITII